MHKFSPENVQKVATAIAKDCLAMRVRYLNRTLTSVYDDAFRPFGITASQVNLLVAIINRGSMSPVQLGNLLNIEKSTVSRNLERMRKAGWIEITAPSSGKTNCIEVTENGKRLLHEVYPHWEEAQKAAGRQLGWDGANALREIGDRVREDRMKS